MITTEKHSWIKANLRHGDIKKINDLLPAIDYNVIAAVLNNRLWGEHGQAIIDRTVSFLEERLTKEKIEKEKYSALLSA